MKILSGVTPSGDRQRAELFARLVNKGPQGAAAPNRQELLSLLLSDTANLSQFIRMSGLSAEVSAALVLEARNSLAQSQQLSPRSMGEINELLAKIRPKAAGVDASYGAAVSFGETGSDPVRRQASPQTAGAQRSAADVADAESSPQPFSPTQADFDKTIDNISLGPDLHQPPRLSFAFTETANAKSPWHGFANASVGMALLVMVGLAGVLLLGILLLSH